MVAKMAATIKETNKEVDVEQYGKEIFIAEIDGTKMFFQKEALNFKE
jgi:hypothetical protein